MDTLKCFFGFIFINVLIGQAVNLENTDIKSFDELYADGLEAYWNENWEDCIQYLEKSLISYSVMKEGIKNCSIKCSNILEYSPNLQSELFSFFINKAACLETCEKEQYGQTGIFSRISYQSLNDFKNKKAYIYLQFAYFRAGNFGKSVEAAYTYSQYDPSDVMMQENMKFFNEQQNTTSDMFINRELPSHMVYYNSGLKLFAAKEFQAAAYQFEQALIKYYEAEEECRAICEGEYDGGKEYLDEVTSFHLQTVDHCRHLLECYLTCPNETARTSINQHVETFLPRLYVLLHHSYFNSNDTVNALQCLQSFLLFFPDDQLYSTRLNLFKESQYFPREEALKFDRGLRLQAALLRYIYQSFGSQDRVVPNAFNDDATGVYLEDEVDVRSNLKDGAGNIFDTKNKRLDEREDVDISHLKETPIGYATVDSNYIIKITNDLSVDGPPTPEGPILSGAYRLLANSSQMAGPLRFALDNFSSSADCQMLIDLELTGGLPGDGYRGKASPHTNSELFHGISVQRAVQLAERGKLPLSAAKLYYDLSERARQQVAAYFKLEHLYFDYTHLVCRTARKGSHEGRTDNSHPVHADNCILREGGDCAKEPPAFTWRDYSAIMYLNEDFEGGQFVMTDHTGRRVVVQVQPQCGRLVSFSAGKECLHGVKPVTRGRRCAMALWFTLDVDHDEISRMEAKATLDRLLRDEL